MGLLTSYDHDVFISYSHANNQSGWVTRFRDKLVERLKEYLGEEPAVFMDDRSIQGNDELDGRIGQGASRAAIFVPIVSRSYVTRPWCQRECREFREAKTDNSIRTRIFPVRYDDVSPADFQTHVGNLVGYLFFGKDEKAKHPDTWEHDRDEFKWQMNTLRTEIGEKLQELQGQQAPFEKLGAAKYTPEGPRPTVMLAESTRNLQKFRDNLIGYLRGYQIEVLQPADRFYEVPDFESAFDQQLATAEIFVQLLGRFFEPHEDETIFSWDQWQYRRAEAAGKPILSWFHKFDKDNREIDLATLDATHRVFVKSAGVWDNDFELFKQLVLNDVQRYHQLRRQQARVSNREEIRPLIVLRSDKSDSDFAERIGETLTQQQCEWVRIPDKEVASLEEFTREYTADGMLVVYHSCPGRWVLTRLQELRKFLKSDSGKRWACGLWRAPEDEADALSCSVDGLIVIEPPEQRLSEFLNVIRQRLAGATA